MLQSLHIFLSDNDSLLITVLSYLYDWQGNRSSIFTGRILYSLSRSFGVNGSSYFIVLLATPAIFFPIFESESFRTLFFTSYWKSRWSYISGSLGVVYSLLSILYCLFYLWQSRSVFFRAIPYHPQSFEWFGSHVVTDTWCLSVLQLSRLEQARRSAKKTIIIFTWFIWYLLCQAFKV